MMERRNHRRQPSNNGFDSCVDQNILILDQNSSPCSSDRCGSVSVSLQRSLAATCVEAECSNCLPDGLSFSPDVILLRVSLAHAHAFQKLVGFCREKWKQAAMFALFCPRSEHILHDSPSLLQGIDDFLSCPFQSSELFLRLKRLFQSKQCAAGPAPAERAGARLHLESLIGESENFLRAVEKISLLAPAKAPVLVLGETGTGKELFARAIHYQGNRRGKPFIPVNCGALPDHLFENELFGHVKGAFTDASSAEKGLIAEAEGGTLFLDEVDALSHAGQVKLLRFLQDGEYRPVGSARTIIADVRVIAATNTDLIKRVESKLFRDDLYYRLNFLSMAIPPLRERIEDVVPFTAHFLRRYAKQDGQAARVFSFGALEKLMAYSWPGNIRELESVITKTLTFSTAPTLEADDIELPSASDEVISRARSLRDAKSRTVQAFERGYLMKLLAKYQGNVTHAAKAAGKERRTFQRLLRKHNLSRISFIA
jgi:DNA-binding NtrC family response regulator